MATTKAEIDDFHRFALERLSTRAEGVELDQLLIEWYDAQDRDEINDIVRRGLADIDAGRGRDVDEVNRELILKYGLTAE